MGSWGRMVKAEPGGGEATDALHLPVAPRCPPLPYVNSCSGRVTGVRGCVWGGFQLSPGVPDSATMHTSTQSPGQVVGGGDTTCDTHRAKGKCSASWGMGKYSCRLLNRKGKSPVPLLGVEPGPQAPNQKPLASPPKPLRWGTFLLQPRQGALYDESCFSTWVALSTFLGSKGRRHRGHRGDGTCRHGWRHSPQNLQGAGDTGLRLPACASTHRTAPFCCQLHVSGDGHF